MVRGNWPGLTAGSASEQVAQSLCLSNCAALYLINIHSLLLLRVRAGCSNPARTAESQTQGLCALGLRRPSLLKLEGCDLAESVPVRFFHREAVQNLPDGGILLLGLGDTGKKLVDRRAVRENDGEIVRARL